MPGFRQPGPTCGHSRPAAHGRNHVASAGHHDQPASARVIDVDVEQGTFQKSITFNRPVSLTEASKVLFSNPNHTESLIPVCGEKPGTRFAIKADIATFMSIRSDVRNALIVRSQLMSNRKPWDFAKWLPKSIQDDIRGGAMPKGLTIYKGDWEDWGDILVWRGNISYQYYWEYPDDIAYYQRLLDDERTARLVHFAYTEYNKDMRYFVEKKGMSPEDARDELRRINEEIFKLILGGAATIMATGSAISQVNSALRANAQQLAQAVSRSPRYIARMQSPALVRAAKTAENLQNNNVNRNTILLTSPRVFRHSLYKADIPALTYVHIKNSGGLRMSTGAGAHYGEGVYVWAANKSVPSYIDVEVGAGVAVEELNVRGEGVWYRLVPPNGNVVPIKIVGTNIPEEQIKTFTKALGGK